MKATNNKNAEKNINKVNEVKNQSNVIVDNKSELAGMQDKVFQTLRKNFRNLLQSRTTINGRLIDLASVAGDYRDIVKSKDFKAAVKSCCDHLTLVQTDKAGTIVDTFILPCKFVALSSLKEYTDYKIEDLVIKQMGRKSATNWALVGYTHDGNSVSTGIFADLRHDYTHEVVVKQQATAADGTTYEVPVYEIDENGNKKAKKVAKTEVFVPVYCDTISPKDFEKAVAKAIEITWMKLFK